MFYQTNIISTFKAFKNKERKGNPFSLKILAFGALTFFTYSAVSASTDVSSLDVGGHLKSSIDGLVSILTGMFVQLLVAAGTVWGAFQAYTAGRPVLLAGAAGTGLGLIGMLNWAKSAFTLCL